MYPPVNVMFVAGELGAVPSEASVLICTMLFVFQPLTSLAMNVPPV